MQEIFDQLCSFYPFHVGKAISARERENEFGISDDLLSNNTSFTYGETSLSSVARLLEVVENHRNLPIIDSNNLEEQQKCEVFLDVGSGIGKPVFAAALLRSWSLVIGVELLHGLHEIALEIRDQWRGGLPYVQRGVQGTLYRIPKFARKTQMLFRCGDITDESVMAIRRKRNECDTDDDSDDYNYDDLDDDDRYGKDVSVLSLWELVDVAYACSTCFDELTLIKISQAAMQMRSGTFFATSGVQLPDTWGKLIETIPDVEMSWGTCTIYVFQRH